MKLSRHEIQNIPLEGQTFETTLHFEISEIPEYMGIRAISEIDVDGKLIFDPYSKHLLVDVHLSGELTLICSISAKDVPFDFETEGHLVYGFDANEDKEILPIDTDELDLNPDFLDLIWCEVPSLVISDEVKELPHGQHWEVVRESDYVAREKEPDERLAKLKEFKFEDE